MIDRVSIKPFAPVKKAYNPVKKACELGLTAQAKDYIIWLAFIQGIGDIPQSKDISARSSAG